MVHTIYVIIGVIRKTGIYRGDKMGSILMMYLVVGGIFFFILYNVIMSAVKEGTLNALVEYEKIKKEGN